MRRNKRKTMFFWPMLIGFILLGILIFYTIKNWPRVRDIAGKYIGNNRPTSSEEKNANKPIEKPESNTKKPIEEEKPVTNEKPNTPTKPVEQKPVDKEPPEEKKVVFNKERPFDHLAKSQPVSQEEQAEIAKLPQILQQSISKYPETKNELLKYFKWTSKPTNYDLTGIYQKGELPRLIQWDSRWGFEPIGNYYLAYAGCGPTVMSSLYIYATGDTRWNPVVMSKWAYEEGFYRDETGTDRSIFTTGANSLGLESKQIPIDLQSIKSALDQGYKLAVHVSQGDFTRGGHYIIIHGYDSDGKILIHDVNSPRNSQIKWDYDRISNQIQAIIAIR